MKSNRIKLLIGALVLILLVAVGVSQTVKRVHMHGMHGDGMLSEHAIGFLTKYLELNDAQQAQAKEILAKEKPTLDSLFQQMKQGHEALKQLEASGTFDEAKVRSVASQQSQTMTDLIVEKARIHSQLFQILTPDQRTKMTQLMDKHERGGMRHHGGSQDQQNQPQDQTPSQQ
jgi:Spy/CpxP family protein refolding chaperone